VCRGVDHLAGRIDDDRYRYPTPALRASPGSTCWPSHRACAGRSASSDRSRASTARPQAARTSSSRGEFCAITGRALKRRVAEQLERLGLADAADRRVKTDSGGMQRRLDVAMGLIHRPQVLFLDEPTTGLDPEARARMWREIERLAHEEGMKILLTTHYLEEVDRPA
jgi:ABC-2 type transport system ATP-binding protein